MNHEARSHTFNGLRGPAISVPLGFDLLAPQHTTPNVGGDTLRDNSAKKKSTYIPDKKKKRTTTIFPLRSPFNTKMLIVMKYSFLIKF